MPTAELHQTSAPAPLRTAGRALADLRREFARRGWSKRRAWPVTLAMVVHTILIVAGTVFGFWAWQTMTGFTAFAATVAGILVAGVGSVGIATTAHTPSHFAASSNRRVNEVLTFLGYSFLSGFSATYWWRDHVSGHHTMPNVQGADNDFDFLPAFAVTETDVSTATGLLHKYYTKWQAYVLPPALLLMGVNLQRCGWIDLIACLKNPARRRGKHILDLFILLAHFALFIGLPLFFVPLSHVLVFYFARLALVSIGMFTLLVPAHFPLETPVMERAEAKAIGHCALQTYTTINYNGGPFVHLMATGLDYQIEHHLFPEISHVHYRKMSPLVAEFCREQGLPYRTMSLSKALWASYKVFIHAKPMGVNPALL